MPTRDLQCVRPGLRDCLGFHEKIELRSSSKSSLDLCGEGGNELVRNRLLAAM